MADDEVDTGCTEAAPLLLEDVVELTKRPLVLDCERVTVLLVTRVLIEAGVLLLVTPVFSGATLPLPVTEELAGLLLPVFAGATIPLPVATGFDVIVSVTVRVIVVVRREFVGLLSTPRVRVNMVTTSILTRTSSKGAAGLTLALFPG